MRTLRKRDAGAKGAAQVMARWLIAAREARGGRVIRRHQARGGTRVRRRRSPVGHRPIAQWWLQCQWWPCRRPLRSGRCSDDDRRRGGRCSKALSAPAIAVRDVSRVGGVPVGNRPITSRVVINAHRLRGLHAPLAHGSRRYCLPGKSIYKLLVADAAVFVHVTVPHEERDRAPVHIGGVSGVGRREGGIQKVSTHVWWGGRERSSRARDSLEILSSGGLEAEIEAEVEAESPERSLVDWEIP
jgi:hypothetical protein